MLKNQPKRKSKPKVFMNLLNMGQVETGLEFQLYSWMRESGDKYEFKFSTPSARPIANNRNTIAKKFLESDCDVLGMIDSDMGPFVNPFGLLDYNKDVIGMVYPGAGKDGIRFHVYKLDEKNPDGFHLVQYPPETRNGLQMVDGIGTGCIFIRRRVLEVVKRPFEDIFDEDGILLTNDDLAFCKKCREAGFEIWTHWDYVSSHWKRVDLMQMANLIYLAAKTGIPKIAVAEENQPKKT